MPRPVQSLKARWQARVSLCGWNGEDCLDWDGMRTPKGYGYLQGLKSEGRRILLAHRVAWQLYVGAIPPTLQVCHHCDNPGCVNIDHMFLGTNKQNHEDKARKGRAAKGSANGNTRLLVEEVLEIKKRIHKGESHRHIGKIFNIHSTTVSQIRRGATWAHV